MSVESETTKAKPEIIEEDDPLEATIDHRTTPRCEIHPEKEAETECDECGRLICGIDMKHSGTVEICYDCFQEDAEDSKFGVPYSFILGILPIFIVIGLFLIMQNI